MCAESLQESERIPEPLVLRLVHLQGAVISGGKVCRLIRTPHYRFHSPTRQKEAIVRGHCNYSHSYCSFQTLPEKRPPLHHLSLGGGSVLRAASLVLPQLGPSQGRGAAPADPALLDGHDPPAAQQQPRRAAGGDQGHPGELLPAPQLEPAAEWRARGRPELGRESHLPPEPNAE